jgi:hypothetical protein
MKTQDEIVYLVKSLNKKGKAIYSTVKLFDSVQFKIKYPGNFTFVSAYQINLKTNKIVVIEQVKE